MTRDDIIRLAEEAGWTGPKENVTYIAMLERFANLVATAERNRIWTQDHWTEYERGIAAIERDECAKVIEAIPRYAKRGFKQYEDALIFDCANVIRARGSHDK